MVDTALPIHPIQKRDNYICQYYGKDGLASLDHWHDCTIDHVVPFRRGGQDTPENLVTCCGCCNAIKGARPFASVADAKRYVLQRRAEPESDFQNVRKAVRG